MTTSNDLSDLQKRVSENEKQILLLKAQYKEMYTNMSKIHDKIEALRSNIAIEFKALNNKLIAGMGTIIVILIGIIVQK